MPAVNTDTASLPRLPAVPAAAGFRRVADLRTSITTLEGEGFQVRRPFPGMDVRVTDPFILLDQLGAVEYAPGEAKGAPDHPHRGFETVTYVMDGAIEHKDSTGGGGLITDGGTQWMTAGAGIVHSEMPTEELVVKGGMFHGVQLWVNLPRDQKWSPPQYQDIDPGQVSLVASADGGALVRLIAGDWDGFVAPGRTRTPIRYAHATLAPGARLELAWPAEFNAMVYALSGAGTVGSVAFAEGQLAVLGAGDALTLRAADRQGAATSTLEVLLLGGRPIREPVAAWGPFVMNTRDEIVQAVEDFRTGRMGSIPATRA
ncbi:MAG: pirin family protein [Actinomycetota bacterium]